MNKLIIISIILFLSLTVDAKDNGDYYSKTNVAARVAEKKLNKHKKKYARKQFIEKITIDSQIRRNAENSKDFVKAAKYYEMQDLTTKAESLHNTNMFYVIGEFKKTNKEYLAASSPIKKFELHRDFWLKHSIIDWDFWMQRCKDIAGNQYYEQELIDYNQKPPKKYPYKSFECTGNPKEISAQSFEVYKKHKQYGK